MIFETVTQYQLSKQFRGLWSAFCPFHIDWQKLNKKII